MRKFRLAEAAAPAARPARRRAAPEGGYGGVHRTPSAGVKTAEGGIAPAMRSLDARVPGGAKPPRKSFSPTASRGARATSWRPVLAELIWGAPPPRDPEA